MKTNKWTRLLGFVGCLVFIVATVCVLQHCQKRRQELIEAWFPAQKYGFSTKYEFGEGSVWMSAEELESYQAKTDEYNSGVCYNALTPDEKIVYNALEYAWDNNYNFIYVVEDAGYENNRDIEDIITLLASDSPLLQQNVKYSLWETDMVFYETVLNESVEKDVPGTIVEVDNFTKERTDKALNAVEEAKKIELDFSEAKTDREKARIIYDYITENVVYGEIGDSSFHEGEHLYNAVVKKETICDGFSNMFSLLCNVNGIKCFEKVFDPDMNEEPEQQSNKDGEDTTEETPEDNGTGHTWCVVLLDGKWYNVDPTVTRNDDDSSGDMWLDFRFGFADELQLYDNFYNDLLPDCNESLFTNYIVIENYDNFVSVVGDAVLETEDKEIYVFVQNFESDDESYTRYFKDLTYYTNSSVYSSTISNEYARVHHIDLR